MEHCGGSSLRRSATPAGKSVTPLVILGVPVFLVHIPSLLLGSWSFNREMVVISHHDDRKNIAAIVSAIDHAALFAGCRCTQL